MSDTTGYEVAAGWRDRCRAAEAERDRLAARVAELEALVGSLSRRLCACSEALSRAAERRGLPVPEAEPGPVRSLYELRLARLAVRARWAGCVRGEKS